jgi:DNA-binding LacI/PurR family transcriptional regulator
MAGSSGKRIGVAIPIDDADPWHLDCCEGILRYATAAGWACVVDPYMVGMAGKSGIGDYDGVVGRITRQTAAAAAAMGIPVVNHWLNSPATDLPSVFIDHRASA